MISSIINNKNQNNSSRVSIKSNSSTGKQRITRKTDSSKISARNRSKSREQSTENGFITSYQNNFRRSFLNEDTDLPSQLKLKKSQSSIQTDKNISLQKHCLASRKNNIIKDKKRDPTPVKSKRQLIKSQINIDSGQFQKQLYLVELETKLTRIETIRKKLQQDNRKKSSQISKYKQTIAELQTNCKVLFSEKHDFKEKNIQLEKAIFDSQNNLNAAHSTLNKLKKVIKENRINELQEQVKNSHQKILVLAEQNKTLKLQNSELIQDLGKNIKQTDQLRKKVDLVSKYRNESLRQNFLNNQLQKLKDHIEASKTSHQLFLQNEVKTKNEIIFQLTSQIKCLKVKIHYMQHTKNKEIRQIIEDKQRVIQMNKLKYLDLIKKTKQESPTKISQMKREVTSQILNRSRKRSETLLQLSPEY